MVVRRNDPLRTENDLYVTPGWMVDHLMREGAARTLRDDYDLAPPLLLEPCVGTGRIVKATNLWVPDARWITNDIDRSFEADTYEDASKDAYWQRFGSTEERPDWVITNPPFSDAFDILIRAYEVAKFAVAMLLRITWPEPTEDRGLWLEVHPPTWEIKMRRWKFQRSSKSQDNATTCWFVWIKDPNAGPQRIIIRRGLGEQPALAFPAGAGSGRGRSERTTTARPRQVLPIRLRDDEPELHVSGAHRHGDSHGGSWP